MTPEQINEARRWVALPGWRWVVGMLTDGEERVVRFDRYGNALGLNDQGWLNPVMSGALPDVTDPATRGCLSALAREMTGDPTLQAVYRSPELGWSAWWGRGIGTAPSYADTETAALLAAVEDYYRARG